MTSEQKQLVATTFARVKPVAHQIGYAFYDHLFTLDPSLQKMFRRPVSEQSAKLMQAIAFAVASLDRMDVLVPALEEMGRRHADYGVRDEHYETVGEALLWTLRHTLGTEFTPAVEEAWGAAYGAMAGVMRAAAPVAAAA